MVSEVVVKLKRVQGLKADGNALFAAKAVDQASAKFEEAVMVMSSLETDSGRDIPCPSSIPQYVELWQECMQEKKSLDTQNRLFRYQE